MARSIEDNEIKKRITGTMQHKVVLFEREAMSVDGVINVDSFDEEEIILETARGDMSIRGNDLHIKQLNLNEGCVEIEGIVDSVEYFESAAKKSRGFFSKLLK